MSRSIDRGDGELLHQQQNIQNRMAVGRGGSADGAEDGRRERPQSLAQAHPAATSSSELSGMIEQAAADKPTMSQFVQRLEERGVAVVPSFQSSGRLNGISYRYRGLTVKGSSLGRAYSAQGLQQRKGVNYDAQQDNRVLQSARKKAGLRHIEMGPS